MSVDRDALLARIRKLMAMTQAAGCTEAEALAAAEKLRKMIDEHGITPEEISADQYESEWTIGRRRRRNRLEKLWGIVAWYCDCATYTQVKDGWREAVYFGVSPRPMIASYVHDVCEDAARWEIARFRKSKFYRARRTAKTRNAAVAAFVEGFIVGLFEKMAKLKPDLDGTRLMDAARAELFRVRPGLTTPRALVPAGRLKGAGAARWSGRRAGYATEIDDGVGAARAVALIGQE